MGANKTENLARAAKLVADAAKAGANVVSLPVSIVLQPVDDIMRKGPQRPESLSYQKKDHVAHPSIGMTPT